jgi:hypothetical protein
MDKSSSKFLDHFEIGVQCNQRMTHEASAEPYLFLVGDWGIGQLSAVSHQRSAKRRKTMSTFYVQTRLFRLDCEYAHNTFVSTLNPAIFALFGALTPVLC